MRFCIEYQNLIYDPPPFVLFVISFRKMNSYPTPTYLSLLFKIKYLTHHNIITTCMVALLTQYYTFFQNAECLLHDIIIEILRKFSHEIGSAK